MPEEWWIGSPNALSRFPLNCYPAVKYPSMSLKDIRELIGQPCRTIYRLNQDQINLLAVIHGTQLLFEEIK